MLRWMLVVFLALVLLNGLVAALLVGFWGQAISFRLAGRSGGYSAGLHLLLEVG